MPETPASYTYRDRAESFGSLAQDYDRFRPSYPRELIDDLMSPHPRDVLDVGSGTGKAAVLLAARGVSLLGVEIDPRMAEIARGHGLAVEVGSFETWDDAGRRFDLITCAQAWHWIDPAIGTSKAATVLRPGGRIARFWNYHELDDDVRDALDAVYLEHAVQLYKPRGDRRRRVERARNDPFESSPSFSAVIERDYRWESEYSAQDWVGNLATHSDHSTLPADQRDRLLTALQVTIKRLGGSIVTHSGTYCLTAERLE